MKYPTRKRLTLDDRVDYEIVAAGRLDPDCISWNGKAEFAGPCDGEADHTVITGVFDQAALHGLLRRIYSLGFPLISVKQIEGPRSGDRA